MNIFLNVVNLSEKHNHEVKYSNHGQSEPKTKRASDFNNKLQPTICRDTLDVLNFVLEIDLQQEL